MFKADLWIQFTGMAYGFESVVVEASLNQIKIRLHTHEDIQKDKELFLEILANPQLLRKTELRLLKCEKISLERGQDYVSLVTQQLPRLNTQSYNECELVLHEVFAVSSIEQQQWLRIVERFFASR